MSRRSVLMGLSMAISMTSILRYDRTFMVGSNLFVRIKVIQVMLNAFQNLVYRIDKQEIVDELISCSK